MCRVPRARAPLAPLTPGIWRSAVAGDRGAHHHDGTGVAQRAQGEPAQAKDVAADEGAAGATPAFELDGAALDHNERIPPLGLVVDPLGAGRDRDLPQLKGESELAPEEGEAG